METVPERFDGVAVLTQANIYFDGRVVSHTVLFPDGTKKTVGLIFPGTYHFTTGAPEVMAIFAGACRARLAGQADWHPYPAGTSFAVPGKSAFDIEVEAGIAEYVCSFR